MIIVGDISAQIVELLNIMAEIGIIFTYFSKVLTKKYDSKAIYAAAYFLSVLSLFTVVSATTAPLALMTATICILLILSLTIYSERLIIKLFYVFIYVLIIFIADPILMGIMYLLRLGSPNEALEAGTERIVGMVGTKFLYFWMVLIVSRVLMKKVKEIPLFHWISIILMPIISIVVLYSIFISIAVANNNYSMVIYLISIAGMVYINVAMFNFFESYSKQMKLAFMETVAEREAENYRSLRLSYKEMQKLKHDFQNELAVLKDMIVTGHYKSADEHISEISDFINKSAAICYTGNEAVDSLINIKIKQAEAYDIKIAAKVHLFTDMNYNSMDLCRIIGNALDNAIEACCKVKNQDRFIYISFKEVNDNVLLEISNSSCEADTEWLVSTKSDRGIHGYGVESIYSSAERIGGNVGFKYSNGIFTMRLLYDLDKIRKQ